MPRNLWYFEGEDIGMGETVYHIFRVGVMFATAEDRSKAAQLCRQLNREEAAYDTPFGRVI